MTNERERSEAENETVKSTEKGFLYEKYQQWCKENNCQVLFNQTTVKWVVTFAVVLCDPKWMDLKASEQMTNYHFCS
jgi:hypothetical protein